MLRSTGEHCIIIKEDSTRETKEDSVGVEVEQTLGEEEEAT